MLNILKVINSINAELENKAVNLGLDPEETYIPVITLTTDGEFALFKVGEVAIFGVESIQELLDSGTDSRLEDVLRRQLVDLLNTFGRFADA